MDIRHLMKRASKNAGEFFFRVKGSKIDYQFHLDARRAEYFNGTFGKDPKANLTVEANGKISKTIFDMSKKPLDPKYMPYKLDIPDDLKEKLDPLFDFLAEALHIYVNKGVEKLSYQVQYRTYREEAIVEVLTT